MRLPILGTAAFIGLLTAAVAQTPMAPAAMPPSATPSFMTVPSTAMLTTNLVGLDVYNGNNDKVGTIKDVAVDTAGLDGYILSVGGFLGMGQHYVAVSPTSINIVYNTSDQKWHATVNATAAQLKAAPEFKYDGKWNAGKA